MDQGYPSAWHAVVDQLPRFGADVLFGLPGDDLTLLDALEPAGPSMVICRDQRNAVFMAIGYAHQTGLAGVCALGKGPAVTNALTGVLEASAAAAPLVVLAAGTATDRRGTGAFQELDQISLMRPLVKWAYRIEATTMVIPAIEKAFLVATRGAPGPVYLEIPDDLLTRKVARRPGRPDVTVHLPGSVSPPPALPSLRDGDRPILLVGGGMRHGNRDRLVERLAEAIGAAVFTTASGRGAVAESHPQFCGLSGLYAAPETAELWRSTDLVVAIGSRLEETATLGWEAIASSTPVIQVNIDAAEVSTRFAGPRILADAGLVLRSWLSAIRPEDTGPGQGWLETVRACRNALLESARSELQRMGGADRIHVAKLLAAIGEESAADRILVQENGLQDMWSYFYPYWSCGSGGGSIVPSEQTSLGFGAAAAVGAAVGARGRQVIAFVGDGAFDLFRRDLGAAVGTHAPILYVVLRNGGYGWLQYQLDRRRPRSRFQFTRPEPDADRIPAEVHHVVIDDKRLLRRAVREALAASAAGRVAVAEVPVGLDDVHPNVRDLAGDFPITGHPSDQIGDRDDH